MTKMIIGILVLMFTMLGCPARTEVSEKPEPEVQEFKSGEWITDYDLAVKYAENSGLPIMINFTGSDWCIWCIRLKDEVFSKKEFLDYARENLILLELDFPRDKPQSDEQKQKNTQIRDRFMIRGYPTIVLMDSAQKEIARTGYQQGGAVAYVNHIKQLLNKK